MSQKHPYTMTEEHKAKLIKLIRADINWCIVANYKPEDDLVTFIVKQAVLSVSRARIEGTDIKI